MTIDLNADLGEGFGNYQPAQDPALLTLVTSANIACGFHAGDPVLMRATVRAAAARGVAIGAHPAYPDLMGFGRRELAATPAEIEAYVLYQVGALAAFCDAEGARLRYVKPHGALYHRAAREPAAARAVVSAMRRFDEELVLLGPAGSILIRAAQEAGLRTAAEAFVDRAYRPDGSLVPRSEPGAVLHNVNGIVQRALRMVRAHVVAASDGTELPLQADSLCIHSDTPDAVQIAAALRQRFEAEGIQVAPFAS